MTETKTFGVADILTHTTGRLLTPIGDVYLFLEWVTGEPHRLDSLRFPVRILTRVTPPAGGAS